MSTGVCCFAGTQPFLRPSRSPKLVDPRVPPIARCKPSCPTIRASATPPFPSTPGDADPALSIAGTPCFTPRIIASPMPSPHRDIYLHAVAAATASYLSEFQPGACDTPVSQITLLLPQLNPELDVYDRRFLLRLAWAVLDVTAASCGLRTRVLIQGTGAFGAIPLSVAGLRRIFDADLEMSREAWPDRAIRSGLIENPEDIDDKDEVIIVISPTNAVSVPVIDSLVDLVDRTRERPVILLNPRLADVPSHSGVMQVSGRADRIRFLESIADIFYLRLLYTAGTMYPLRGILYRAYPGPWQIWQAEEGGTNYRLISSTSVRPCPSDITSSFSVNRYAQQKERFESAVASGSVTSVESVLVSPTSLAFIALAAALTVVHFFGADIQQLAHSIIGVQSLP